ncbi:MAG: rhomboid family intramembrane serine protease [Bacteroidetes bacterium]|nr:rhomboid family intramembrane serine protease [Bacteroidota bacterium]
MNESSEKAFNFISLLNLTGPQALVIAVESAKALHLKPRYITALGFSAETPSGLLNEGDYLQVLIEESRILLHYISSGGISIDGQQKHINAFIETFEEIRHKLHEPELSEKYQALLHDMEQAKNTDHTGASEQTTAFKDLFRPREGYFVTPILIGINILIFILMVASGVSIMSPGTEELMNWGANLGPVTLAGQWWRLISCCFIHIGIIHLALNMYALLYIGAILEPILGRFRFFSAYILAGICGSLVSALWNDPVVAAGASGAIFGMYGVYLALLTTNLIDRSRRNDQLASMVTFIGYNLIFGLKGGIDNAAHIGGLLGGAVIGYAFYPGLRPTATEDFKKKSSMAIIILALGVMSAAYFIPNRMVSYESDLKQFTELESEALKLFDIPETASAEMRIDFIKTKGLPNWEKCLAIVEQAKEHGLPESMANRNDVIIEYCKTRIESYELIRNIYAGDTTAVAMSQLDSCNAQLTKLLDSLN